jgi:signal recognition particle GTPase
MSKLYTFSDLDRKLRWGLRCGAPFLVAADDLLVKQIIALIGSLTREERESPRLLLDSPSRWSRAVQGAGVTGISPEFLRQLMEIMAAIADGSEW